MSKKKKKKTSLEGESNTLIIYSINTILKYFTFSHIIHYKFLKIATGIT